MAFRTSDIVLAAVLKLHGNKLIDIEKNGPKGIFVFDIIDKSVVEKFDLGNATVEPVTFNNAIKQLTTAVRRVL